MEVTYATGRGNPVIGMGGGVVGTRSGRYGVTNQISGFLPDPRDTKNYDSRFKSWPPTQIKITEVCNV